MNLLNKIETLGVLPVIKIDNAEDAPQLGNALLQGGIPAAEITFRTGAAEESIRRMAQAFPELLIGAGTVLLIGAGTVLLIGAGTVLTIEQCDRAVAAGARFIVSPGYDDNLVTYCLEKNILILPGCATPSDISKAYVAGLKAVKFFPAEQSGGLSYLKAVAPVYPKLRFMPTGGVNAGNLNAYLAFDNALACGGSRRVREDMISAKFAVAASCLRHPVEEDCSRGRSHYQKSFYSRVMRVVIANVS